MGPIAPTVIRQVVQGVYPGFALLAAMKLDLFSATEGGSFTVDEIGERLGVDSSRLVHLLYLLVDIGLLSVEDERFANTPEADAFLVPGRPSYIGGLAELYDFTWRAALDTAESIRSGVPQSPPSSLSEERREAYLRGLGIQSRVIARQLLASWDFSAHRHVADVGGGSGVVAMALTEAEPELTATIIEHPEAAPICRRLVEEAGAPSRVSVRAADVIEDGIPGAYDAFILCNFLQTLPRDEAQRAVANVARALSPNGAVYICDRILDDSRLGPRASLHVGILFVNIASSPFMYTQSDYLTWLEQAGLSRCETVEVPGGHVILRASADNG